MEDSCHLAKESHFAGEHHYQREVMMLLLVLVFGSLINRRVAQEGFIHLFSSFIITFRLSINHRPIEMNVILRLTAGQSLRPISSGRLGLKEIRDVKDYRRMDSCFKYYVNANPFLPNAITLWESLVCEVGSGRFSSNNRVTPSRRDGI